MNDDEKRGYQRGYYAGTKRRKHDASVRRVRAQRDANWNRAYLALLPVAMVAKGWQIAGRDVDSSEDRVKLAKLWADRAITHMKATT